MNKKIFIIITILFWGLCQCHTFSSEIIEDKLTGWRAGVASIIITPEQPMWMGGYASRVRPAEGTLHDLKAKALILEDSRGQQAVLVTTDLLGFPKAVSDHIRNNLQKTFGFSKAQVILNSSHTHSGPVLEGSLVDVYPLETEELKKVKRYSDKLREQIVRLVEMAFNSMQPVQLYAGNGFAKIQVNRRNNDEKTVLKQTGFEGPNDYAVPVLKVTDRENEPIAIIFGYGCHPTVLNGYEWNGDFPGYAQIELEKLYPGATALFFQGAGADQNPLPRRTLPLAMKYGKELAVAVEHVLESEMRELTPELSCAYSEIHLPIINQPTPEELFIMQEKSSAYKRRWAARLISEIKNGEQLRKSYPYPLQVWSLGEQPIVSMGGELVTEYALELKRIFGQHIFVMGYSNDVMGYIPSSTILTEGGYEAASSQIVYGLPGVWAPTIEIQLLNEIIHLAEKVGLQSLSEISLCE